MPTKRIIMKEVKTARDSKMFHALPGILYKNDPFFVPSLLIDEKNTFHPRKNPAYRFCKVVRYLAFQDGKCVGRIAGIINERVNQRYGENQLRITRFDFIDDTELSSALFEAVETWGKKHGAVRAVGPLGFCDLDIEGMLIDGFKQEGPFFTLYNAPYYHSHLERLGYQKDADWVEYRVQIPKELPLVVQRSAERICDAKVHLVQPRSKKDVRHYADRIFRLLNLCYRELYGFVELDNEQIRYYTKQYISVVPPEYVKLLLDDYDRLIGFGIMAPSLTEAMKKCGGRLFPAGWFHVLRALHGKSGGIDLYIVGIHPEWQGKGLPFLMIQAELVSAVKNGFTVAYTGPELEDNYKVQSMWRLFQTEKYRRRRSYTKQLITGEAPADKCGTKD